MTRQELESQRLLNLAELFVKTAEPIPSDKRDWRPAETAKSAIEIVTHCVQTNGAFARMLGATDTSDHGIDEAASLDEALTAFRHSCEALSEVIAAVPDDALDETVTLGSGRQMPKRAALAVPGTHVGYHWGQLAYLQTLWGDEADHFAED